MSFLFGLFTGAFALLGYVVWRMLRSDGWDSSNVLNALRLLSHVAIHPEDFGKMYYLDYEPDVNLSHRPFWYISEDEFEGVVKTRPER